MKVGSEQPVGGVVFANHCTGHESTERGIRAGHSDQIVLDYLVPVVALQRRHSRLAGLKVVAQQHRRTYHSTVWECVKGSAYRLEQSRRPDDRTGSGVSLERCKAERFVVGRDVGRLASEQLAPRSVGDSLECDEGKGDLREKLEQNLVVGEFDAQVSQQFLGLARVGGGENGVAVKTFADGPEHRTHHDCRFACSSRHPDCPESTVLDDLLQFVD